MTDKEKQVYLEIARSSEVFTRQEIEALLDVLDDCGSDPHFYYILFEERLGDVVVGFAIIDKTAISELAWDIYWLVVDKQFQGKGFGKRLLKRIEDFILQRQKHAVLKIETSAKKEYAYARNLYIRHGYHEIGRIPHFYALFDGLIIYSKEIKATVASKVTMADSTMGVE